jgi:hypothetical protein
MGELQAVSWLAVEAGQLFPKKQKNQAALLSLRSGPLLWKGCDEDVLIFKKKVTEFDH